MRKTVFSLSDVYIRKMEQCTDVDALMKLNEQMAIEFTLRVAEAKKTPKNYYSPAISRVIDYIYHGKIKPASSAAVINNCFCFCSSALLFW